MNLVLDTIKSRRSNRAFKKEVQVSNEELEKVMKLNLINGVTKLRSMRGNWDDVNRRIKYVYEKDYYPRLYLSPSPIQRNHELSTSDLETYVKTAKEYGYDFIKT